MLFPVTVGKMYNLLAKPFAPFPLQKLLHYYDSVRHFITLRLPLEYLESRTKSGGTLRIVMIVSHVPYKSLHKIPAA